MYAVERKYFLNILKITCFLKEATNRQLKMKGTLKCSYNTGCSVVVVVVVVILMKCTSAPDLDKEK